MPRQAREIPWIDNRGGLFYVNWYKSAADPEAKGRTERLSLRTRDRAEAQDRYIAFLSKGDVFSAPKTLSNALSVESALDNYYNEHVTANVVVPLRQEIAIRHLKAWFGDAKLSDVDIPACRSYAQARRLRTSLAALLRRDSEKCRPPGRRRQGRPSAARGQSLAISARL